VRVGALQRVRIRQLGSRSLKDALNSLERIEAAGGKIYSATERFESSTSGRTMRNFAFVMAQDELERARDSFRAEPADAEAAVMRRRRSLGS
jgi:DNA invertase Pin-like site-specific DNA recombinase